MRKHTIFLACLVILAVIIIILAVLFTPGSDLGNSKDGNGLTAAQKKEAIDIALSSSLKDVIPVIRSNSRVTEVSTLGAGGFTGKAGYLNTTGLYAQVPVSVGGEGMYSEHYVAYVNLTGKEVTGTEWASYRRLPASAEVSIPPRAGWYHEFTSKVRIEITCRDKDSMITPVVLDETNFRYALEGKGYQANNESLKRASGEETYRGTLYVDDGDYLVIWNNNMDHVMDVTVDLMPGI